MTQQISHWQSSIDETNIFWLQFDRAQHAINVLDGRALEELDNILEKIEQTPTLKGLVIYSGKTTGFILGADIEQFAEFSDLSAAKALMEQGQSVLARLAKLAIPTVAMIAGYCLGGGLELALACRYRVAQDDGKTFLGLPEVKLGIHPGWGGTVRMVATVGHLHALDLMMSGRFLVARAAHKIGLVDANVPERQLRHAAEYFITHQPKAQVMPKWQIIMGYSVVRHLFAKYFHRQLRAKVDFRHYPAPFKILELWEHYASQGAIAYAAEINSVIEIIQKNDTAKNLIRVFKLQEQLKGLGKTSDFSGQHIHVVGAGTMGGDIAAWCALRGFTVTLADQDTQKIGMAIARAHRLFKEKLKQPQLIEAALDRLIPDSNGEGVRKADLIIEAIFEDLAAKQTLFKALEEKAKSTAILATNTSSIPLDEINGVLSQPERLVGIHFFNPVAKMLLVEVVRGSQTANHIYQAALSMVRHLDRLPLPVSSSPGFLVNRVLMPYLLAGMKLYEANIPPQLVDEAARDFGMPMGPLELADKVGLDICLSVAKNLVHYFGGEVPSHLVKMVAEGKLGYKSSEGFYIYRHHRLVKPNEKSGNYPSYAALAQQLIEPMIAEAKACLVDKVVADKDLIDAGMIFGTGFAPFLGGPLHYTR